MRLKRILLSLIIFLFVTTAYAGHIAGGEIYYTLVNTNNGLNEYKITVRLFRECEPPLGTQPTAPLPASVTIGIFRNTSPITIFNNNIQAPVTGGSAGIYDILSLKNINPCITNAPAVCYQVAYYSVTVVLPSSPEDYIIAFETCCRTNGIENIGGSAVGATYTANIPGTTTIANMQNQSAVFNLKDTTLICKFSNFNLDFSASDPDNDSLVYSFCDAYTATTATNATPIPASNPPYFPIPYASGFTGVTPLGANVAINSKTGIISGVSPGPGSYVLNVCVSEYRAGKLITVHRKDFTLKIGDCELTGAQLKPSYINCDSSSVKFQNESTSSSISSYFWDFGVPSLTNDTSTNPTPLYNYPDTGNFTIKLVVQNTLGCRDSTTAKVLVYPGFVPNFNITGSCFLNNYQFTDLTVSKYGAVNKWHWDFGDLTTTADTSIIKNPIYKYPSSGSRDIRFIVSDSKGCIDTIMRPFDVKDKPIITLPFKDTLICSIDTLQLQASVTGVVKWSPAINISNTNILNPLVWPKDTVVYKITVNDNGCINEDSVTVNVLDFITVQLGPDTGICRTDSFVLKPKTDALNFLWTPATGLSNTSIKNPIAKPLNTIKYFVTANLGKCQDRDSINVFVTPYPQAIATADTSICFNSTATLRGNVVGSSFFWSPTGTMTNANTLSPTVRPFFTTSYVLTVFDTVGCPKPSRDTVLVTVLPQIIANAGNDTSIVANQPLQLTATGGTTYQWSPNIGMDNPAISNPIVTLGPTYDSVLYTVTVGEGFCSATDNVMVRVFKSAPDIYMPSAFTPNRDGKNDIAKPILRGMKSLNYFRIFNRWGELLYTTTEINKGWDGNYKGIEQASGTYVYIAQAIDYTGKTVFRKGTVVLIR